VTRSTRLLAIGVTVLVVALVVMLVSMRSEPDPIVVTDAAPETAAAEETAPDADTTATGTVGALADDQARLPSPLEIPEGHEAVAISSAYDAAVAALPVPGDTVNVYAVFQQRLPDDLGTPTFSDDEEAVQTDNSGVVRALSGVEVLGVTGVTAETGGGSVTLILALEPDAAERTIYLAAAEQVWFTLVAEDHEAVPGNGVTRNSVLDGSDLD